MSPREQLSRTIRNAAARGQPALVAYLTAGFPSRERFRDHLRALASAADVVEVGVPFTDPMADGVTIQRASLAALAQGVSLAWIIEEIAAVRGLAAPLLLMSYLNPLLAFGIARLAECAARGGVSGFIVPDLPLDESSELGAALDEHQLALVQMVTPVTEPRRWRGRRIGAGRGARAGRGSGCVPARTAAALTARSTATQRPARRPRFVAVIENCLSARICLRRADGPFWPCPCSP